jgi:hypothetical protein
VKWRAILLGTLLLVPAYWAVLAGVVSAASDDGGGPVPGPLIAFGLCLVPFLYVALAVLSQHPRVPGAVLKAMVLTLLIGIPVSAVAADAVTGMVAGIGAGGIAAIRADPLHSWKARALGVAAASLFVFLAIRTAPEAAILLAPCLPFTAIGIADHLSERRASVERAVSSRARRSPGPSIGSAPGPSRDP